MNPFASSPNLTYLGKLETSGSTEIVSSRLGVGFETLDRDLWDPNQAWPLLDALGVKWARVQTGWAKTERTPGHFDFSWLDEIVDNLIRCGVTPWLSISYGNPLYTEVDNPTGVGWPPLHSPNERQPWQAYVRALTIHFRNRITHYEVWNEPDLSLFWKPVPRAADYVDLVRLTAAPLREQQPGAKLIGGAIAWGMTPWSLKFLEDCLQEGLHDLVDIITFHGYKSIPERHSGQEFPAFKHLLRKFKPSLEYWQGETGVQSRIEEKARGVGPLTGLKATEEMQARMLLRRFLLELDQGCTQCSWFHMADFGHYAGCMETFHFGLIRREDGSPKPSYFAMQTLATLLQDPMEPAAGRTSCHMSVLSDTDDPRATKATTWHANFVRGDVPVHAWWFPESLEPEPIFQSMEMAYWIERDLKLDQPVLIEPISQSVYAVAWEMDKRTCAETWMQPDPQAEGIRIFKPLPICNSPLFLTDRSIVPIANDATRVAQSPSAASA